MKILFLTTEREDYLQDSILHGLRNLFGSDVIDYPQKKILYKKYTRLDTYGKGFTLYNLLDDIEVKRNDIIDKLNENFFNIIIFGSIQRQTDLFFSYKRYLHKRNTIILDGEDSPILFPNHRVYEENPLLIFQKRVYNNFKYYKRELTSTSNQYRFFKILPIYLINKIALPKNVYPISFSIPEEKIIRTLPFKTKMFPKHIVDEEVAFKVKESFIKYAFENELDYYADLQSSRYGITTKRAGWDCLRHYEIAANGAVICFKDLDKKPDICAPHGLIPGVNCISYKNYDDLMNQIGNINDERFNKIQASSLVWINNYTTINCATRLIENFNAISNL